MKREENPKISNGEKQTAIKMGKRGMALPGEECKLFPVLTNNKEGKLLIKKKNGKEGSSYTQRLRKTWERD